MIDFDPAPFQRPVGLGEKDHYTEAEQKEQEQKLKDKAKENIETNEHFSYNALWFVGDQGRPTGRTSLIVDPENGRLPPLTANANSPLMQNAGFFLGAFLVIGMVIGKLARIPVDEAIGTDIGLVDRLSGAALGAVRVGLVATSIVLVFDQLIPSYRQPAFLQDSQLRPIFSAAGQKGVRALPPELTATIDRLKRERHI